MSTDSKYANAAWAKEMGISYPLLSDFHPQGAVASAYGVQHAGGMAERALFLIDKQGIVRYIDVHQLLEVPDEAAIFEELAKLE